MRIVLATVAGLLVHFNPRSELHGEDREPAADVKLSATVDNKFLDQLHGTLRHALFFHDTANPGKDLVDKAMEENPNYLPHRRFAGLGGELRWAEEMTGGKLTLHYGVGGRSDIVLPEIKLNKLSIVPKDGGVVEVKFRVQCKPDEEQAGKLCQLVQKAVSFSIEPPKEEAAQIGTGG